MDSSNGVDNGFFSVLIGWQNKKENYVMTIHSRSLSALTLIVGIAFSSSQVGLAGDVKSYKSERGPFDISDTTLALLMPEQDRTLQMRVVYPTEEGDFPVIVFSHGGATVERLSDYSVITDHWASHGYAVVRPVHVDALARSGMLTDAQMDAMQWQPAEAVNPVNAARVADVSFIVDSLEEIETNLTGFNGQLDTERLVMAGHSYGSAITLGIMGVKLKHPKTGFIMESKNDRFDAAIFLSEPGNTVFTPYQPWRAIQDKPSLVVSGSNDFGKGPGVPGFRYEVVSQGLSGTDKKHLLYIQDLDQRWGGLIRGDDEYGRGPDHDALEIIRGVTTAFLDAYIKSDPEAAAFLTSREIEELSNSRASLTQ